MLEKSGINRIKYLFVGGMLLGFFCICWPMVKSSCDRRSEGLRENQLLRTAALVRTTGQAIDQYFIDSGKAAEGSEASVLRNMTPGYIPRIGELPDGGLDVQTGAVLDVWHRPLVIRFKPEGLIVYSVGPNGTDEAGLGDDISYH